MINLAYVRRMARYNQWQNSNLYAVADELSDEERRRECGAFFGSIHKTLSHLLWGDRMWMNRFADTPRPEVGVAHSVALYQDWEELKRARIAFDATILEWAERLDPAWLDGDLTWFSGAIKAEVSRPKWQLVTHFYNHQTHHRGQVHCMLTQAGKRPQDTDLFLMPE